MGDPKGMWRSVNELTYRKFTSNSSIRELQSNQVKRSRRYKRTNEFIHGKMISFVDSIIHS